MNIFRLVADMSHLLAMMSLAGQIILTKSSAGVSGKTQLVLLSVFVARYVDLFTFYVSLYNSALKMIFIATTFITCYLIHVEYRKSYNKEEDSFRIELIMVPSLILALFINAELTIMEVLWTYSIYAESVAILPQLYLLYKLGFKAVNNGMLLYLGLLGTYRGFYILNWMYRNKTAGYFDPTVFVSGSLQTLIFIVAAMVYVYKRVRYNSSTFEYEQVEKNPETANKTWSTLINPKTINNLPSFVPNDKTKTNDIMEKMFNFK